MDLRQYPSCSAHQHSPADAPSEAEALPAELVALADADLRRLLAVWDRLTPQVRRSLAAIAEAVQA